MFGLGISFCMGRGVFGLLDWLRMLSCFVPESLLGYFGCLLLGLIDLGGLRVVWFVVLFSVCL